MDFSCTKQPWLSFKHPLVRELAFCIASPPLLSHWPACSGVATTGLTTAPSIDLPDFNFWQQQFSRYLPRLQQLDRHADILEQHMLTLRSRRLGLRFEHLLAFWLQDDAYHAFRLLGRGIKRMDGQRTLGEMDFLLANQDTGQTEHWEVAIKFYLGEHDWQPEQWLGPNRRDSLARKLTHLRQHQFNVTDIHAHHIEQRRAIVKGRLFYPAALPVSAPEWTTSQHLKGLWGNYMPVIPNGFRWRYVSRQEWMVAQPDLSTSPPMQPSSNLSHPVYWRGGLYLLLNTENKVVLHYMLRITDKTHKSLNNHNTLKPNPNAADIFNQISII